MKHFIFCIAILTVLVSAIVVVNSNNNPHKLFDANIEALAQVEGLKGNCRDDSNDCLFMCSCGAIWEGKTTLKGPSYNISGVCSSCKKEY